MFTIRAIITLSSIQNEVMCLRCSIICALDGEILTKFYIWNTNGKLNVKLYFPVTHWPKK